MDEDQIKYSDLIKDDGAIQRAIAELQLLQDAFADMRKVVVEFAKDTKSALATVSGATEDGRASTKKAADETNKLAKAERDLAFALSDVGAQIAELKMKTSDANRSTQSQAAYVNAASNSYNEFKAELASLTAAYKAMTKEQALNSNEGKAIMNRILTLKVAVKELDQAIKLETQTLKANTAASQQTTAALTEEEKARQRLANATTQETATLLDLAAQTKEAIKISQLNIVVSREAEGSYNKLSAQYSLNKIALNKMSAAEREGAAAGVALEKQTMEIYQQMIRLQEVTGSHSLSVGNYRKVWDGLGHSMSQVIREMPAAAINANTLFLALSNNIPILADEIKNLKEQNIKAAESGQPMVSLSKKIVSAIFSWNTAIVMALTLLSMFGSAIWDWTKSLFTSTKAIEDQTYALELYNKAMAEGQQNAQKDLVHLRLLYNASQDYTKSITYRTSAIGEMRRIYPDYLKDMSDEQILAGDMANTYLVLAGAILKKAKAQAAEQQIVENEKEILQLQDMLRGYEALKIMEERKPKFVAGVDATGYSQKQADAQRLAIEDIGKSAESTQQKIDQLNAANKRLAQGIDVRDLFAEPEKAGKARTARVKKETEDSERWNLYIKKRYAEATTALIEDELVNRTEALVDAYEADKRMLLDKYDNEKTLTEDSRNKILDIIIMGATKLGLELDKLQDEIDLRKLRKQEQMLQMQLETTEEGSYDEADARLRILENSRQQELITNRQLIESQRQDEKLINDKWNKIIADERARSAYEIGMKTFDIMQEYYLSEFDLLRTTEAEKTKFKLKAEKDRWAKMLAYARNGALKLTEIEYKTIENYIKKLEQEIAEVDRKNIDFYAAFGLKLSNEEKRAMSDAFNEIMDNLKAGIASEIELAEIAISKAHERVEAKQAVYDAEVEARNNGYAFNVTQAQKELEAEKKILAAAQKNKEKYVIAQQRLNSITQAGNLLTASTEVWAALGGIPPLAIAAIALMWGSFAWSKVKAAEVTKAQTQTYGEGGFEVLNGGSHQSGNDVPIGRMQDGRERRAEGGEGLAIIAKDKMRKYGKLVPDIVKALNKGIFEDKYAQAFNVDSVSITSNGANLRNLEDNVREIKEQGERKLMVDGKGRLTVYYKNLKTTYLS